MFDNLVYLLYVFNVLAPLVNYVTYFEKKIIIRLGKIAEPTHQGILIKRELEDAER